MLSSSPTPLSHLSTVSFQYVEISEEALSSTPSSPPFLVWKHPTKAGSSEQRVMSDTPGLLLTGNGRQLVTCQAFDTVV